jgi:hypothetical protein
MLLLFSLILRVVFLIFVHLKIIFIFLINLESISLRNLLPLFLNPIFFVRIKFVSFPNEPYVGSFLFDFSILDFLFVLIMKVSQSLWHGFAGAFKSHNEIKSVLALVWSYESYSCSLIASSACATHSMDVIFEMIWANVVHNKLNMANVEASSANTSCHHNISNRIFKVLNETLTIYLVLTTV